MPNHYARQFFDEQWKYTEGVEDLGYQFGADRVFADSAPTAKLTGIKGRRTNPTQRQMMATNAAGLTVASTDQTWTIWSSTFMPDVMPVFGDIILVNQVVDEFGRLADPLVVAERWMVLWSKWVLYGAQYLCYCAESPLTRDTIY